MKYGDKEGYSRQKCKGQNAATKAAVSHDGDECPATTDKRLCSLHPELYTDTLTSMHLALGSLGYHSIQRKLLIVETSKPYDVLVLVIDSYVQVDKTH